MAELSVAVVAKGRCDARPFWRALAEQGFDRPEVAVHLAHDHPSAIEGLPAWVSAVSRPGTSLFGLTGVAIAAGHARHVALLQVHAPPLPGWLPAMLAAIRSDPPLCWGPVEAAYAPGDPRLIGYLVEYCQFHAPVAAGMDEVPGNNVVLRRAVLPADEVLLRDGFAKSAHVAMLRAGGIMPERVDAAAVLHRRPFALGAFCARRFRHGRAYAAAVEAGVARRLMLAAGMALLPAVRVARILGHARRDPALHRAAWRHLPAIAAAEACWSAGEAAGYLSGRAGDPDRLD